MVIREYLNLVAEMIVSDAETNNQEPVDQNIEDELTQKGALTTESQSNLQVPKPETPLGRQPKINSRSIITEDLGWTGGQYSLWRAALGAMFMGHFLWLWPARGQLAMLRDLEDLPDNPLFMVFPNFLTWYPSPTIAGACLLLAVGLSGLLAVGWGDKAAAVGVWYVWACCYVQQPNLLGSSWPFLGWLLLAHVCVPAAPFGSWAARGRVDPRGGWKMPPGVYAAAWVVMSATFAYQAWIRWELFTNSPQVSLLNWPTQRLIRAGPLTALGEMFTPGVLNLLMCVTWGVEASFALFALFRMVRPWLWTIAVALQLLTILFFDTGFLGWAYLLLLGFTFNPAWLPCVGLNAEEPTFDRIYYDGGCGLCHRTIRWILSEDRAGSIFRLAPLDSESFRSRTTEAQRGELPDSVIVIPAEGPLLSRSAAVLRILLRLGGYWRMMGWLGSVMPRALLDVPYNLIARVRHRLFRKPSTACPILPPDLRERFEY